MTYVCDGTRRRQNSRAARRFRELHAVPDDREIAVLEPIERLPRALQMLELEAEPVSH